MNTKQEGEVTVSDVDSIIATRLRVLRKQKSVSERRNSSVLIDREVAVCASIYLCILG